MQANITVVVAFFTSPKGGNIAQIRLVRVNPLEVDPCRASPLEVNLCIVSLSRSFGPGVKNLGKEHLIVKLLAAARCRDEI